MRIFREVRIPITFSSKIRALPDNFQLTLNEELVQTRGSFVKKKPFFCVSLQPTVDVRCSDEAENPVAELFGLFVGLLSSLVGCMALGLVSSLAVLVVTGLSCWNATLKAEKAAG